MDGKGAKRRHSDAETSGQFGPKSQAERTRGWGWPQQAIFAENLNCGHS